MKKGKWSLPFSILLSMFWFAGCDETDPEPVVPEEIPRLQIGSMEVPEGDTQEELLVPVGLSGESDGEVRLSYETRDGTATGHLDYVPVWGELVFPPGKNDTTLSIPVTIYGNKIVEEDEYFEIHLFDVENAEPADTLITVTLLNDDTPHPEYPGYSTPMEREGMMLIWHDEFDIAFNPGNWKFATGDGCPDLCGWGNGQLQYYRPENTEVANGLLTITARKENYAGSDYTSSRILSQDRFEFRYGRVDIRARLPEGKGIWPALWMLGANRDEIGWPECGEIDIMEMRGSNPSRICGTLHYQNGNGNHQNTGAECFSYLSKTFHDEFHVISLLWDEEGISWYVNDLKFHEEEFEDLSLGNDPNPFRREFYFLLNVAVGGHYDGNPNETTVFPQKMEVDYIRVFQPE